MVPQSSQRLLKDSTVSTDKRIKGFHGAKFLHHVSCYKLRVGISQRMMEMSPKKGMILINTPRRGTSTVEGMAKLLNMAFEFGRGLGPSRNGEPYSWKNALFSFSLGNCQPMRSASDLGVKRRRRRLLLCERLKSLKFSSLSSFCSRFFERAIIHSSSSFRRFIPTYLFRLKPNFI